MSILGLLLGIGSAPILLAVVIPEGLDFALKVAPIPAIGLILSLRAWSFVRANRDQYTGANLALAGAVLSALFLVGGVGYAGVVHSTEVPEGYTRVTFLDIKPSEADLVARRDTPESIQELIDKKAKIFVKGYFREDSSPYKTNVKSFRLVRDNNQCCFGDLSKVQYFDQIGIKLKDGLTTDYSTRIFRVAGVLQIDKQDSLKNGFTTYVLEADYIR